MGVDSAQYGTLTSLQRAELELYPNHELDLLVLQHQEVSLLFAQIELEHTQQNVMCFRKQVGHRLQRTLHFTSPRLCVQNIAVYGGHTRLAMKSHA